MNIRALLSLCFLISANAYAVDATDIQLQIPNMLEGAEIKYEIPKGLLSAIAHVESSGDHNAFVKRDGKGNKSSYGLLQLQLASARTVKFKGKAKELMNPETNIEYGAAYFRWLLETHSNNVAWSLTCWNSGPNSSACKNKRYSSYVGLVLNAYINQTKESE